MKDKVNDSLQESVNLALEAVRLEAGDKFSLSKVNLAELGRRTGISQAKRGMGKGITCYFCA